MILEMRVLQKNTACENAYNNLVNDSRNEGASKDSAWVNEQKNQVNDLSNVLLR